MDPFWPRTLPELAGSDGLFEGKEIINNTIVLLFFEASSRMEKLCYWDA